MVTIVSIVIQPIAAQGYNGCSRGCRYSSYDSYGRSDRYLGHIYRYILCLIFT
nr:MAG TPA: hypothetical protein [Bacteriophage sp.]